MWILYIHQGDGKQHTPDFREEKKTEKTKQKKNNKTQQYSNP